jgi:hypothetical protein
MAVPYHGAALHREHRGEERGYGERGTPPVAGPYTMTHVSVTCAYIYATNWGNPERFQGQNARKTADVDFNAVISEGPALVAP